MKRLVGFERRPVLGEQPQRGEILGRLDQTLAAANPTCAGTSTKKSPDYFV
ncbi:hypothetical protein Krac_11519 [Ktedonobacter racemifer DSM 44963]|uniref:Uncharacterized protein n=1 Tax=Ktedonobacter racemifer DSM 44963 TaxID=485913 RepID=D6TCB3_KTERA|nr:hypothetical protein Krac_11519 [Ktedonobacter racemifer DSM 44963]